MPYIFTANDVDKEFMNIPTLEELDQCLQDIDININFDEPAPFQEHDQEPVKNLFNALLNLEVQTIYIGNDEFSLKPL